MIISGGAFSQYSPTVDTLYLYRGGEFYYYNTSGDTVFINADTIFKESGYYFTTVDISRADVDILHTDSVVLIPAPGVNKYINVTNAVCRVSSIRTPNIGAGTLDMVYNTATGYSSADVIRRLTATSFNTIDTTQWDFPKMIITGSTNTNQINNKSVVLWLSSAQAGDATSLKIYITYQILDK